MNYRSISKITQNPWAPGFLGRGHKARAILDGMPYNETDPFVLFMDDNIDLPGGEPVGGAHPHAGFEVLTLVLHSKDKDWPAGSFELMTAGKGIIHSDDITEPQQMRILQVWLALPKKDRYAQPFHQRILLEEVPTFKNDNMEVRVYSGSSQGLTSPLRNRTPFTLVDFHLNLNKHAIARQDLPNQYQGLIYVIEGSVKVGDKTVRAEQAGWINSLNSDGNDILQFEALEQPTRFVLYAGQPHREPTVHYGPFVADSMEAISQMYKDFRRGMYPHLKQLPEQFKLRFTPETTH